MTNFIHRDPEFKDLLAIVANEKRIDIALIEKDYWIMHVLYSLQQQNIEFELKGGTSLSKGFGLIDRFSEDIDIHIKTNFGLPIEGKADKPAVRNARKSFYDLLTAKLNIDGITKIERDYAFDDLDKYRSGGIRLYYESHTHSIDGLKDGILLEVGFDQVTPNQTVDISSWVWQHLEKEGLNKVYQNNSAEGVACYHPGYTLIEKLQTIIRKYRNRENDSNSNIKNFMRQYYDVYCLLQKPEIIQFIGSEEYLKHKSLRIRGADGEIPLSEHPALLLSDKSIRETFAQQYKSTSNLYYNGQPDFELIISGINKHIPNF
ncbi:MAG: nucleotidyl transferase AbiEii/AbiGii toxin family protein [Flavobacteriales bacterium]|nr:nucleotidyl transferase AbiEii/AbiGii toxin family protein [Flavobacteriales bacterium]